jgi:hypothetical protein
MATDRQLKPRQVVRVDLMRLKRLGLSVRNMQIQQKSEVTGRIVYASNERPRIAFAPNWFQAETNSRTICLHHTLVIHIRNKVDLACLEIALPHLRVCEGKGIKSPEKFRIKSFGRGVLRLLAAESIKPRHRLARDVNTLGLLPAASIIPRANPNLPRRRCAQHDRDGATF